MQEKETEIKGLATEIKPESEETAGAPEGEQWVALPAADFEELIQKAAKAAVAEFKKAGRERKEEGQVPQYLYAYEMLQRRSFSH